MKDKVYISRTDTDVAGDDGTSSPYSHLVAYFQSPDDKRLSFVEGHGDSRTEAVKDLYRAYESYKQRKDCDHG